MKLTHYNTPFARTFGRDFDSLFDRFFETATRDTGYTDADLYEEESAYHVRLDLPGVKKEQLNVELDRDRLVVSINRSDDSENGNSHQTWRRTLRVPENLNPENVTAKLEDGVLTVSLPKAEEAAPYRIEVK